MSFTRNPSGFTKSITKLSNRRSTRTFMRLWPSYTNRVKMSFMTMTSSVQMPNKNCSRLLKIKSKRRCKLLLRKIKVSRIRVRKRTHSTTRIRKDLYQGISSVRMILRILITTFTYLISSSKQFNINANADSLSVQSHSTTSTQKWVWTLNKHVTQSSLNFNPQNLALVNYLYTGTECASRSVH